jgi:hypothetical protein
MNAKVTDNVTVKTRMTLLDTKLGATASKNANLDRANIVIKDQVVTGGTWSYGRMDTSNTKFFSWGGTGDRIKAVYGLAGGAKAGAFIEKSRENNAADAKTDKDMMAAFYVGDVGAGKLKATVYSTNDDASDLSGNMLDIKFTTKAGAANVHVELARKAGDLYAQADNDQLGIMAMGTMALSDTVTGAAILAHGSGGFDADDDFTPSLLIGTSQVTAITNFGNSMSPTTADGDSALLIVAGAHIKLSDDATFIAGAGLYDQSGLGGAQGDGMSIMEIDLAYKRNLAKNTNFFIGLAYGMPDGWSADDDAVTSLGWQITTKW